MVPMSAVGGDFYDFINLGDGKIGIAIGDVSDHGVPAALFMAITTTLLRSEASRERSPAEVLRRLESFALDTEGARLATVAYAILDPVTGVLRYCVAGHPPPLLLGPDGAGTFLWEGRSGPLGVSGATERVEATAVLEAGSTVVLYSDGLFERRGELLDVSLGRLRTEAVAHRDGSPDQLADGVLAGMLGDARKRDDVALLVASLQHVGHRLVRRITADPGELARLRHEARDWLVSAGVDLAVTEDAVLALGEAAANAVEHAYLGGAGGDIELEMTRDDDAGLCIVIRDFGRWRAPAAPGRRGRGIWIMRRLAHDVSTTTDGGGTTVTIRMTVPAGRGASS
jgi:anti-sigma regulatory factor (Ser/Thr protein kinase)